MLAEGVCAALGRSRFPAVRPTSHGVGDGGGGGAVRILSVDMGIRNLAVCLLEVLFRPGEKGWGMEGHHYRQRDGYMMLPSVIAWQRMCIPPSPTTTDTTTNNNNNNIDDENDNDNNNTTCSESIPDESPASLQIPPPTPPAESFSTSTFSRHAYNLAITLLRLSGPNSPPDQILIETQRYRSAGGAAVQEWTLRVNMLESMLWGCLRTLAEVGFWGSGAGEGGVGIAKGSCGEEEAEQGSELIEGVNPSKVTGFWEGFLSGSRVAEVERLQTTYAESKKSKTRIVKGLLCPPYICTQFSPEGGIPLFELGTDQAREAAELFLEVNANGNGNGVEGAKKVREPIIGGGKKRKKQPKGKLDDLADCLLQGLAWVKWEEGRRRMISGEGFFAGVDITKLVERAKTLEEGEEVLEVKKGRRRKAVEEQVGEVGALEVAAKGKRRARVKKLDIQENDTQEVMPQEIEAISGKGTEQELEVEDICPASMPIVVPAKKPRKPRTKKVPLPEITFVQPLGSETRAGEGTVITQDSEEFTPQDIIALSGKEEVEAKLKPVVEVEVKDTPPTSIHTVVPALLPTKTTSKPRAKKVPLGGIVYVTPPKLETEAGEGKVSAKDSEGITPQENVAACVREAEPDMEDIHAVAPVVEQIVESVLPPPLTKKIRKPRAKKLPSTEVMYIQDLKTEARARAGERMVITPDGEGITRQEVEAVAENEEAELQPGPEPEMDTPLSPLYHP